MSIDEALRYRLLQGRAPKLEFRKKRIREKTIEEFVIAGRIII
jgi:hypothetical protein